MSKFFPKLTQTHVHIITDEKGNGFNCPMLPVSMLAEMHACSEALSNCKAISEFENIRQRMIELAKIVMPEQYWSNLERFDIPGLSELISYLMYGGEDDLPRKSDSDDTEKN